MSLNPIVQPTFEKIYSDYMDFNGRVMIAAHRGNWRRASENSLQAIQSSIDLGLDVVEIDIRKTKDGILVLMHDDTVDRMTTGTGRIEDLTYQQIRNLQLKLGRGGADAPITNEIVPTLHEAMVLVKNRILVNLDKCWNIREDVYKVLAETGTVRQGLFKSDAGMDEIEEFLSGKVERPEFILKIQDYQVNVEDETELQNLIKNASGNDEIRKVLSDKIKRSEIVQKFPKFNGDLIEQLDQISSRIQPKAFELNFLFDHSTIITAEVLQRLKAHQSRIWVNTMFFWDCGGHTDEVSLTNPALGWEWHMNRGVNMILSDYPEELNNYLQARK